MKYQIIRRGLDNEMKVIYTQLNGPLKIDMSKTSSYKTKSWGCNVQPSTVVSGIVLHI